MMRCSIKTDTLYNLSCSMDKLKPLAGMTAIECHQFLLTRMLYISFFFGLCEATPKAHGPEAMSQNPVSSLDA